MMTEKRRTRLTPGSVVAVYQRPLTEDQFEGQAQILKVLYEEPYGRDAIVQHCRVRFDDGSIVNRFILVHGDNI